MKDVTFQFVDCGNSNIRVWRSKTRHKKNFVVFPDPPNLIEHHLAVLPQIAQQYNTFCVELPGFGYSKVNHRFSYSMPEYINVLTTLFNKLDIKRADVEVPCLGALILLYMAKASPSYFNQLYLLQCCSVDESKKWLNTVDLLNIIKTPFIGQLFMKTMKSMVARNWYRVALCDAHKNQYLAYLNPVLSAFKQGAQFRLADAYQQVLQLDGTSLSVPHDSTVIWGKNDITHAGSDMKSVLQHTPNANYIQFSTCGHFPSLEKTADYLNLVGIN